MKALYKTSDCGDYIVISTTTNTTALPHPPSSAANA